MVGGHRAAGEVAQRRREQLVVARPGHAGHAAAVGVTRRVGVAQLHQTPRPTVRVGVAGPQPRAQVLVGGGPHHQLVERGHHAQQLPAGHKAPRQPVGVGRHPGARRFGGRAQPHEIARGPGQLLALGLHAAAQGLGQGDVLAHGGAEAHLRPLQLTGQLSVFTAQGAVFGGHQRGAGRDSAAGGRHAGHEPFRPGVQAFKVCGLDQRRGAVAVGHGHAAGEDGHQGHRPHRGQHRAAAAAVQLGVGAQVLAPLDPRHHQEGHQGGAGHDHADEKQLPGDKQHDGDAQEDAVGRRHQAVARKPGDFAGAECGIARVDHAVDVLLDQVIEIVLAALLQVGQLGQVAEDVVTVETDQRVGVEQDRADAGDEHGVVGQHVRGGLRAGAGPDNRGDRGHAQLDVHARGPHERAAPAVAEGPSAARVHVRHRGEHHQHHAEGVHLAGGALLLAEVFHGQAVAQLVDALEQGKRDVKQRQVAGTQHVLALVEQLFAAAGERVQAHTDQQKPQPQAHGAKDPAQGRGQQVQQPLGVVQRDAREHDVRKPAPHLAAHPLLVAVEHAHRVCRQVGVDQVAGVKLAQQLDRLALRGRRVAQLVVAGVPHLPDRALAVEHGHEAVARLVHAEELVVARVAEDVPQPPAVMLTKHLHQRPQPRRHVGDAVPRFVEGGSVYRHGGGAVFALAASVTGRRGRGGLVAIGNWQLAIRSPS